MAIYSLNHSTIGRTTHAAGTAGAHIGYITRASACRAVIADHIPGAMPGRRGGEARAWLDDQEQADRKNARVVDKLMIALPLELDQAQRMEAVRDFVAKLANGRPVPFFAAFHDNEQDADNPHVHLVIRDRHPETGKRVIGFSDKGSTERAREIWQEVCNSSLKRAGQSARVDHRSLKAQGVDRVPQGHEGPQPRQIEQKGKASPKLRRIRESRLKDQARWDEKQERLEAEKARLLALNDEALHEELLDAAGVGELLERLRPKATEEFFAEFPDYPKLMRLTGLQKADEAKHEAHKLETAKARDEAAVAVQDWRKRHPLKLLAHNLGLKSSALEELEKAAAETVKEAETAEEFYRSPWEREVDKINMRHLLPWLDRREAEEKGKEPEYSRRRGGLEALRERFNAEPSEVREARVALVKAEIQRRKKEAEARPCKSSKEIFEEVFFGGEGVMRKTKEVQPEPLKSPIAQPLIAKMPPPKVEPELDEDEPEPPSWSSSPSP